MGPICPECKAGKHRNCNGFAGVNDDGTMISCFCVEGSHWQGIPKPEPEALHMRINGEWVELPSIVPANDPGILGEAFPELVEEDQMYTYRMRPDATLILDLMDVEVCNPKGEWVPVVPLPHRIFLGWAQCHCETRRWGKRRYQEHYAYAHILGMEDLNELS